MSFESRKFGTLYLNGEPAKPGTPYPDNAQVAFGPTVAGFELEWNPFPGDNSHSFILAEPALVNISWRQLFELGFVQGKPFEMDGRMFMVHLPKVHTQKPSWATTPVEGPRIWGQETFIGFRDGKPVQQCPVCGWNSLTWGSAHPAERAMDLVFMPVIDEGI